jgi:hypothetical protein
VSDDANLSRLFVIVSLVCPRPSRPADVAKPMRVLIPDYFAYELCAALAKPAERLVDVVHGEHDAEAA